MEINNFSHELVYTDTGYEIIFYLDKNLEELDEDLSSFGVSIKNQSYKLIDYIKKIYPTTTIQAVRFMVGTILIGTIILPAHPQNKIYAQTEQIAKSKNTVTLIMGNYYIRPDADAFLYKDRVMIPLRTMSEVFGAEVTWDSETKLVTIKNNADKIKLWVGKNLVVNNETQYNIDVEPLIVAGRVMVPMRFVMDIFDTNLRWEQKSNTVFIDYDKEYTLDYLVQPGDTLENIAYMFDVSVGNLKLWNNIKRDIIYVGQTIKTASPSLEPIISSMDKIEIKEYDFDTVLAYTIKNYSSHTSSFNSMIKYHNRLTEVSTFTHSLQSDGSIKVDYTQEDIIKIADDNKIQTTMLVNNCGDNGFDKEIVKSVLEDKTKRQKLIDSIYTNLNKYGYKCVEIDFEGLHPETKNNFNQFIKELCDRLKPEGFYVSCALPAKTGKYNEKWLDAYDYNTIGKYVDRVLIMSYDQHWAGGASGPIASVEWVEKVAQYASCEIESNKLLLGIALYGYDWPVNGGQAKSVTVSTVNKYLNTYGGRIKWNESFKSPYYEYKDSNNVDRIVWFENNQSIQFKFEIAKKYGFKGIGLWRLGLESDEFWTGLKSK